MSDFFQTVQIKKVVFCNPRLCPNGLQSFSGGLRVTHMYHTGLAAIDNVYSRDKGRSKKIRNTFFDAICRPTGDKMAIENTVSSDI